MREQLQKEATAGLYIHIPFCEKRCHYCDFYTVADRKDAIPRYVEAVKKELRLYAEHPFWRQQNFSTLYFGGGTPSLLKIEQLAEIMQSVFAYFQFLTDSEVTLEANPGTTKTQVFAGYLQTGINRLSLGVQSFHEDELAQMDRLHSVEDVYRNVAEARAAGFHNISIDLIFALPGQKPSRWRENLQRAIDLQPEHISAYNLTYEPGTPLFKMMLDGSVRPASENRELALYKYTIDFLESHGFKHYEVSNYAKPGYVSRHNSKYWDGSAYLALGASAHGYDGALRWWNKANWLHYCEALEYNKLPVAETEILEKNQKEFEHIFLGLRQKRGVDLQLFEKKFNKRFSTVYAAQIEKLLRYNPVPIHIDEHALRLTREGWLLCDAVCAEFA